MYKTGGILQKKVMLTLRIPEHEKAFLQMLSISNGTNITAEISRLIAAEMEKRPDIIQALRDLKKSS